MWKYLPSQFFRFYCVHLCVLITYTPVIKTGTHIALKSPAATGILKCVL